MGKRHSLFEHMMEQNAFGSELLPGQSIIEIAGDRRVLLENHLGVAAYGREKILVNVKFGLVCISGCNLEMLQMTKEQLIIYGKIDSIGLQRRR